MTCPFTADQDGCPHGPVRQVFCVLRWGLWLRRALLHGQPSLACGACMRHRLQQLQDQISAPASESRPSDQSDAPAA